MNTNPSLEIPFDKNNNQTANYKEAINFYKNLAESYPQIQISAHGITDSGHPLHVVVFSKDKDFDPVSIRKKNKRILMINNAIHPGEPCGVEASMMLLRDYLQQEDLQKYLDHLVIVVIPIYNIGGALNRNSFTRANQDGPEAYGFRGNAKNLDLNRDFIKCDSRNAQSFNQIYQTWMPDIFIDNHTSNGADYQYTMTLIPTQHNRLDPHLAHYMNDKLMPRLFADMKKATWEMTPYVYARETPDEGIAAFLDLARYSSGYASLFNTISFMPETHMLKPYRDRVLSTYAFMDCMIKIMHEDHMEIATARNKAIVNTKNKTHFDLNWTLDFSKSDSILFKGYEAKHKISEVSGHSRLYYDRDQAYEKKIPFFNYYKPILDVKKPMAYIFPQAYWKIAERLKWNGVQLKRLSKDVELDVEMYRIGDFKTSEESYEGHYLHSNLEVKKEKKKWLYHEGDYVVMVDQASNRYIVETLEPQAPDSYFSWNFFDGILMQKEYFSSYVFEDLAAAYLKDHPTLKIQIEERKKIDPEFAASARAQLNFVYENSPFYEPTHRLYPVGRLENVDGLFFSD